MNPKNDPARLVLVGQAPGSAAQPSAPLEGRIGRMLSELIGISFEEYLRGTERLNLITHWMGKAGKGDVWNPRAAERRAEKLKPELAGRTAVLLGRNVAAAFGLKQLPWMTFAEMNDGKVGIIPHPSGIVLWWNEEKNRLAASAFLKKAWRMKDLKRNIG